MVEEVVEVVESTEIDTTIVIAIGREESHGAGVRQGGEEVRQGEREAQATVAVHLHVGSTVEGDDAAQATQATAEAEAAARAEIAAVGEDRRVCLHDEITVAGPCPAQAIRASVGAKVAESADNVDDKWARIDDKIHHTVNGNGDHTARATQTTAGAEAVASAGTDGCNHDLEIILPGAMAAHSDQAFEPARAVRILVGAPAAPAGATAGTVMVEDNSSSSAIFVGAHPADNPLQPC
ncbi:hypothetical protein DOTSEDRAFT_156554 [Dothistroma septosporum NZE10]|uniref:Uncharacterized protein n=1 Tax=Dothistroma septosporum (strain NZE10 / CBS 128990) TaxID=675120 RepID=N1PG51_DOTSN|nr:hypothetical protein DOTSEDRAFT_156554 [Dothistroma septosporum NZE10]